MKYASEKDYYRIDQDQNLISVHFPGVMDLLEYEHNFASNSTEWAWAMSQKNKKAKWMGPTTPDSTSVVNGALIGDKVLYEKHLESKIAKLREATGELRADYSQKINTVKRRPTWNGYGDELDIHKVYQGQLDKAWRRTERIEVAQDTKLVTLFVQVAGLASEDAVESLWRAAVTVLLVDKLQAAGKSVKVVVGGYSEDVTKKQHRMTVSITVKEYNERLSVQRLAAMCHLGFYRVFGFAAKAAQPYKLRSSYGYTFNITPDTMPIHFREDIHKGHAKFVVLDRAMHLSEAKRSLNNAYAQMKEFSDGS